MQRATLAIACLALFVALGGPSQAQKITSALKKNEVKTQHIRNGHVISGDLKDNAIKSIDVKDHGLDSIDVAKATGEITRDFPSVPANDCRSLLISGITDGDDHVAISPSNSDIDTDDAIAYFSTAPTANGGFAVVACNVSNAAVDPGPIDFDYIVFD